MKWILSKLAWIFNKIIGDPYPDAIIPITFPSGCDLEEIYKTEICQCNSPILLLFVADEKAGNTFSTELTCMNCHIRFKYEGEITPDENE